LLLVNRREGAASVRSVWGQTNVEAPVAGSV